MKIYILLSALMVAAVGAFSSTATGSTIKPVPNTCVCLGSPGSAEMEPCDAGACNAFCHAVYNDNKGVCRFVP